MASNWGGIRNGAGRKKAENNKKSVVVRIDEALLPAINILKEQYKAGQGVEALLSVTDNQDIDSLTKVKELNDLVHSLNQRIDALNDKPLAKKNSDLIIRNNDCIVKCGKERARAESLNTELEQFKKTNLDLVLQKDEVNLKAIKLQGKVNSLQSDSKTLKAQLEALQHKEHDCVVLKKDGVRCSKSAKVKINWKGVEINACLQHSKNN